MLLKRVKRNLMGGICGALIPMLVLSIIIQDSLGDVDKNSNGAFEGGF